MFTKFFSAIVTAAFVYAVIFGTLSIIAPAAAANLNQMVTNIIGMILSAI